MKTTRGPFVAAVRSTLAHTPVGGLLAKGSAVVLERIARGGGATRWYFCRDRLALNKIEAELSPGSVVSFYFDERIRRVVLSPLATAEMQKIIARDGDVVVGVLEDEIHIRVDCPGAPRDLEEVLSAMCPDDTILAGAFPARENDGVSAVTVTIPDSDGIVRPHPH